MYTADDELCDPIAESGGGGGKLYRSGRGMIGAGAVNGIGNAMPAVVKLSDDAYDAGAFAVGR